MNLADKNQIKSILESEGFFFKKSLGQNFLINPEVCPAMAKAAAKDTDGVLEIGPGAGVLTRELCKTAKKVVAIELDERLRPVLSKTLAEFSNVSVIFGDAMKLDLSTIIAENFKSCENVHICANLPYYITSPIVMMLLESRLNIKSITVMVQKEAAERLCAKVGSRESGAVTVAVDYYAESEILFDVLRDSFFPAPNVDSAVIKLNIREKPPVKVNDETFFFSFVKACFAQRRKTLLNSVSNSIKIDKDKIKAALTSLDISESVRGEALTMQDLASLSNLLCE